VASRALSIGFGLALGLLITLVGPLALFNPGFTSILQARHDVPAALGTTSEEVNRVTGEVLGDLFTDGDFGAAIAGGPPLLDARERSHMRDVARLVRLLVGIVAVAAVVAALGAWRLRGEPRRQGRIMLRAAAGVGVAAVVLALVFAVAFEPAFLVFHAIFFPPDSYLFAPGSNLITLFPQGFWFDATLAAGATIVVAALIVAGIGRSRARARSGGSAPVGEA
jgi:integral membrane protein (TIGR01906 family)